MSVADASGVLDFSESFTRICIVTVEPSTSTSTGPVQPRRGPSVVAIVVAWLLTTVGAALASYGVGLAIEPIIAAAH